MNLLNNNIKLWKLIHGFFVFIKYYLYICKKNNVMIKVNGLEIKVERFPDGTQKMMKFPNELVVSNPEWPTPYFEIVWLYENDSEMFTLQCVVGHLRTVQNYSSNMVINLVMPFIPNSRMDRVYTDNEVFTLKYFANFINSLNFNKVGVLDAHSNVSLALIDRVHEMNLHGILNDVLMDITERYTYDIYPDIVLYFPDESAYKRYNKYFQNGIKREMFYGRKIRDWYTCQITGLELYNEKGEKVSMEDVKDKVFLMIDDIISHGDSMAYGADKLNELGAKHIYAYASHTENGVLNNEKNIILDRMEEGIINKLYTTNSLYNGNYDKIKIIYEF